MLSLWFATTLPPERGSWIFISQTFDASTGNASPDLLEPTREHEGANAKERSDVFDQETGLVAHGDSLELAVKLNIGSRI